MNNIADLGTLLMKVKADTKQFESGMSKASKSMDSLKKAAKIGTAAIAAGGVALVAMAKKSAANADEVDKMSQKIGISRDAYQEWAFALSQSGADVAGLQMGVKTLAKAAYEASQGVDTYADSFDELGISVTNVDGSLKDQETLLNETITALQGMDDETKRTAIASELLGRSATELAPLLNAGAGGAEEMKKQAHDLGLVLGDEVIDSGVKMTDTMDQIKRAMSAATTNIGGALLPAFQKFMDWIVDHMPEIKRVVSVVFGAIEGVFRVVFKFIQDHLVPIFEKIQEFWYKNGDSIKKTVKGVFDGIISVATNLWELFEISLLPIFKAIYNFIVDNIPGVAPIFKNAFDIVIDIINGVIDTIKSLIEWIDKAVEKLTNFFTAKNEKGGVDYGVGGGTLGLSGTNIMGYTGGASSGSTAIVNFYDTKVMDLDRDIGAIGDKIISSLKLNGIKPR